MSLTTYFDTLLKRVEASEEIHNGGKDDNGFYKPKRTILLRHLQLLKDLHAKPRAREMLRASWKAVTEELPPDWLILNEEQKQEIKKMLE